MKESERVESLTADDAVTSAAPSELSSELVRSKISIEPSLTDAVMFDSLMYVEIAQQRADDMTVANAARVSTIGVEGPQKIEPKGLIDYLMKNRHGTPFEHNLFTFKITAPIFVMREFQRHRVGWSYNEESGRYKELDAHFWLPDVRRKLCQSGPAAHYHMYEGDREQYQLAVRAMEGSYRTAWASYRTMLEVGVAREVARSVLPVATYSSMYATCNARSLMHFLGLRTKDVMATHQSNPMAEIESVARQMEQFFQDAMPLTHAAFHRFGRVAP